MAEDDADFVEGIVRRSRHRGPRKEPLMKLGLRGPSRDHAKTIVVIVVVVVVIMVMFLL